MGAKKEGKKGTSRKEGNKMHFSMNNHQLRLAGMRPGFVPPRKPMPSAPRSTR